MGSNIGSWSFCLGPKRISVIMKRGAVTFPIGGSTKEAEISTLWENIILPQNEWKAVALRYKCCSIVGNFSFQVL